MGVRHYAGLNVAERLADTLGFLQYSFVETVEALHPYYVIRALGGLLFVTGSLIMAWNLYRTIKGDIRDETPYEIQVGTSRSASALEGVEDMNLVGNHGKIEKNIFLLLLGTFVTVIIRGLVEIVPLFTVGQLSKKMRECAPIRR